MKKLIILSLSVFCFSCKRGHEDPKPYSTLLTTLSTPTNPQSQGILSPVMIQNPLLFEGTATWCGYCPRGAVEMKQMLMKYPNVIGLVTHSSDFLSDTYPLAKLLTNNPAAHSFGIPSFFAGNQVADSLAIYVDPEPMIISELSKTPIAAVGHHFVKVNSTYNIQVRVKFNTAATGNYFIGTYAVQNGIIASGDNLYQGDEIGLLTQPSYSSADTTKWAVNSAAYVTGQGNTDYWFKVGNIYTHDHIVTASADGIISPWGQNLNQTSFTANESLDFNFTITSYSFWTKSIEIVTILWLQNGNTCTYVNGYH